MSEEHQSFIKTPKQLIVIILLSFVVPVLVIVLLVKFVGSGTRTGAGAEAMSSAAIEARIQPVAKFELRSGGGGALRAGAEVYKAQCAACHDAAVAGAPKFGDAAAWAPRIKTGYAALLASSLKGKGAMSPQGGGEFSDEEIGRAVVHMANAGGAKFEVPKSQAGATAAAASPAAAAAAPSAAPAPAAAAPAAAPAPAAAAAATPAPATAAAPAPITAPAPAASAAAAPAPAPAAAAAPVAAAASGKGKALYDTSCAACHVAGVAGAPKLGDKAAWAPRVATGLDAMTTSVIKGKGAMPPKGASTASAADLRAAVEYMVSALK
ncbi:MAG: c-type cytochrome [Burkholderiaceae bacterium]|nr:c-type cytochrome [Burkholderiaceae bacterium]